MWAFLRRRIYTEILAGEALLEVLTLRRDVLALSRKVDQVAVSQQQLADKIDKLKADVSAELGAVSTAVAALKQQIEDEKTKGQGGGGPVDLQALADKVDDIDSAVLSATAALGPVPTPATPVDAPVVPEGSVGSGS